MYISQAICLADDQLDLVVDCFNASIAHLQSYRIHDMILVALDFLVQFLNASIPQWLAHQATVSVLFRLH